MTLANKLNQLIKASFVLAFTVLAGTASAQVDQTAELNVTIKDVITFVLDDVNPSLTFDEASDFIDGVSTSSENAATVTASGAYSVSVKAEKNHLEDVAGNKIKVGSIAVQATGSDLGTTDKISLKPSAQTIISAAPAAIKKTFGLTYSTTGNDTEFIGKPAGDYKVKLTYTATLD